MAQFWWSLVLLGVGWNFLYIGGTTLLTETYRPEERAKAQGANDQAIFIMMAISSLHFRPHRHGGRLGARQSGRACRWSPSSAIAIAWYRAAPARSKGAAA